jgi:hypothetical protein
MKEKIVVSARCDEKKLTQKFVFGTIHLNMLRNWIESGAKILDTQEIEDLSEK